MMDLLQAWLLDPLALLFLMSVLLGAMVTRSRCRLARARPGQRDFSCVFCRLGLTLVIGLYLISSAPVVVNPLIALLESTWLGVECESGSHLVLLGGGVDSRVQNVEEFGRMSQATLTRSTEAAHRLIADTDLSVIVAGGAIGAVAEADVMAAYLQRLGVNKERIVREARSGSTRENALQVAAILDDVATRGPVLLLTSAIHMPRALSTFRLVLQEHGLEVCPVSVDVQALENVPWYALMPQTTAIVRFDRLLHEVVAWLIYRFRAWV